MGKARLKAFSSRVLCAALCAALLLGALPTGAHALAGSAVTAQLRPDYTIIIDGSERIFYNVNGQQVHPISRQGTTYLPVRAIGELMGKVVAWDEASKTVTLSGVRTGGATKGTPAAAAVQDISVEVRNDFTIVVDGAVCSFADVNGTVVYPLLYQGSTYLPIRAIGELMGKSVAWDGATNTITLSEQAGSTVTDADVITSGAQGSGQITLEQAKAAALTHAGLTEGEVTYAKQRLEWEHGRKVYEIEFYTADHREFDYEIDAATGKIVSFDYDAESYAPPAGAAAITEDRAQEIALAKVPGASAAHVRKLKLDRDHGRQVYEVKIIYSGMEYELEIDAASGAILEFEMESIYD